ncbi:MAG: hypothetical protein E7256_06235 [Lachnospiraceae bacterium]|nr:hypothetical protein [Lachnospiraceae bacterium]
METYEMLFDKIKVFAQKEERIRAMVLFGSRARKEKSFDEYSDYDIIFFVSDENYFLKTDGWLKNIAEYKISFVEPTAARGFERRIFFDNAMDMDFIFYNVKDVEKITQSSIIQSWYARGVEVIVDKIGYQMLMQNMVPVHATYQKPTVDEFENLVHTFWFHAIWAEKKLLRGEIWAAKNCIDGYMKTLLREMLEYRKKSQQGLNFDTWHDGRFIDEWLEPEVKSALNHAYGKYERTNLETAMEKTMNLFSTAAKQAAKNWGYVYPLCAEQYAFEQVKRLATLKK